MSNTAVTPAQRNRTSDEKLRPTVKIPVKDIKETFFVREGLNEKHVDTLVDAYRFGATVPPIVVVEGSLELVDGRHRLAAMRKMEQAEAECVFTDAKSRAELIVEAFTANAGGPLPNTSTGAILVIRQLIEGGMSTPKIEVMFRNVLPPVAVRNYAHQARANIKVATVRQAASAVREGDMTVKEAVAKFEVDESNLRQELGEKRAKRSSEMKTIKATLSKRYQGHSRSISATIAGLRDRVLEGNVSRAQAEDVIDHIEHLLNEGRRTCRDWRARMRSAAGEENGK